MAAGKKNEKHSPIVTAIEAAEKGTTGEIRVHLSKKWIEKDPYRRAVRLFHAFGIDRAPHRNAVLLYVNLRKRKFAIVGGQGIHEAVGQNYWEELAQALSQDLRGTHSEKAIATAVATIGVTLKHFFPESKRESQKEARSHQQPSNELTED